jgi:hypothetical protein|tara:strand:- start:90 stop:278 length:189 start_codon:yes stop_codon:yes gene_type:complete
MSEMNITSAQYVAHPIDGTNSSIKATIDGVEMYVPINDADNKESAEIQRQIAAGELTIQDAD